MKLRRPLRDVDSAAQADQLRMTILLGAGFWFLLVMAIPLLRRSGILPDGVAGTLQLLSPVLAGALAFALSALFARFFDALGEGVIGSFLWGRGEAHAPTFSEQDALVAQGRVAEAITSFAHVIEEEPGNVAARLRYAALLAGAGRDPAQAIAAYRAIRVLRPNPRQEAETTNALIELYRAEGLLPELKAELARFARQHHRSAAGRRAREYLRQLVDDEAREADR